MRIQITAGKANKYIEVPTIGDDTLDRVLGAAAQSIADELGGIVPVADNIAAEDTADGSDASTTQALANALKTKVNAILTNLKAAGLMKADA